MRTTLLAVGSLLLAAACGDVTGAAVQSPESPALLAQLHCTATRDGPLLTCSEQTPGAPSGASLSRIIVGGQHRFVRLTSSNVAYEPSTGIFSVEVAVQNLLQQPLATADGTTPHPAGIRVFFTQITGRGGTEPVEVANWDGMGTFTAAQQPFFQYGGTLGAQLGSRGILGTGETSTRKLWQFDMGDNAAFSFIVYLSAEVPDPSRSVLRFASVTTGGSHSCALTPAGQAYCWGYRLDGRLGDTGTAVIRTTPVPINQSRTGPFTFIDAGAQTCAIAQSGAYCWGTDAVGRLGSGPGAFSGTASFEPVPVVEDQSGRFTSISVGATHSCGITASGAWCWGEGENGQLGNGGTADSNVPVQVTQELSGPFISVSVGSQHTCGIASNGAYCWGANGYGQLGNGTHFNSTEPVRVNQVASGRFTRVGAGLRHTCGIGAAGAWCWGSKEGGLMGNGDAGSFVDRDTALPVPVTQTVSGRFTDISVDALHVCGITATGAYCWGHGTQGQLGAGSTDGSLVPVAVARDVSGPLTSVSVSLFSSCGMSATGVYCWGFEDSGRLGNGRGGGQMQLVPVPVAGTTGT